MRNITITDVRPTLCDSGFLLDDGKTAILYDTGFAFTGFRLADRVRETLGERKLDYIFLTHSHYDHALGAVYVKRYWPDAKIVAGAYAAKIFAKPTARAVMRDLDRKMAASCGVHEYEDLIDTLAVDISVEDGDRITVGNMVFTAVSLPGHTRCSVGFYLAENQLLLGTETLGLYGGEGIVMPSYLVGYETALASIDRALSMEIDTLLLPHYGVLRGDTVKSFLLESRRSAVSTAEGIAEILQNGGSEQDAFQYFKDKFYHGYVKDTYPIDAMELNTGIMVNMIRKAFFPDA
ncbi:MAG: MBL fold metallo-hydrolase [Clostridia bacterium]|nr:MBL fold metallo-hydrolase [Clostridia bacterium]